MANEPLGERRARRVMEGLAEIRRQLDHYERTLRTINGVETIAEDVADLVRQVATVQFSIGAEIDRGFLVALDQIHPPRGGGS